MCVFTVWFVFGPLLCEPFDVPPPSPEINKSASPPPPYKHGYPRRGRQGLCSHDAVALAGWMAEPLCLFPVPDNGGVPRGRPPGPAGRHQSRAGRGGTLWARPGRREAPHPRLSHPVVYQLSAAAQRPVLLLTTPPPDGFKEKTDFLNPSLSLVPKEHNEFLSHLLPACWTSLHMTRADTEERTLRLTCWFCFCDWWAKFTSYIWLKKKKKTKAVLFCFVASLDLSEIMAAPLTHCSKTHKDVK